MRDYVKRGKEFFSDTVGELKRCSWPSKKELLEQTLLVIVSVVILALFVAGIDAINLRIINWLTLD
ncbi:MAG: preprotein translocase subunit SecE [Victivallales bacterium]|nr:preprotein translocase subunit SecE [Victivallales bacterium]